MRIAFPECTVRTVKPQTSKTSVHSTLSPAILIDKNCKAMQGHTK